MFIQSHLPQSKLLLGTRGGGHIPTQLPSTKKLQQLLLKRLKHLIRPTLQARLQAYRSECVYECGKEKSGVTDTHTQNNLISQFIPLPKPSIWLVHVGEAAIV